MLKTSKAIYDSDTHVSQGTRLGLHLELCEPMCLVESFPIDPERKNKIDFLVLFYMTSLFSLNYSISGLLARQIARLFFFLFKSTETKQVVCSKHDVSGLVSNVESNVI